jgi:hypothetical protein
MIRPRSRLRYVLLSALAGVVLYGNAAVLLNHACGELALRCGLPTGFLLAGVFNVFPVFSRYEYFNTEVVLLGLPQARGNGDAPAAWIALDVHEYFPYRLGEQHARVLAATHRRNFGAQGQQLAWAFLTRTIRERYNRRHPDQLLAKVRIRVLTWPRGRGGYWELKTPHLTTVSDLYTGPPDA